jgi:hypothetical protein
MDPGSPAMNAVLGTVGLLEMILMRVSEQDLLVNVQRVSKGFNSAIAKSHRLQRKLFFMAEKDEEDMPQRSWKPVQEDLEIEHDEYGIIGWDEDVRKGRMERMAEHGHRMRPNPFLLGGRHIVSLLDTTAELSLLTKARTSSTITASSGTSKTSSTSLREPSSNDYSTLKA